MKDSFYEKFRRGSIILLVGVPASGKSTFSEEIVFSTRSYVLSTDNYIQKVAEENSTTYDNIFKDSIGDATDWFNDCLTRISFDISCYYIDYIIIDRTNLTKKGRAKIIKQAKQQNLPVYAVVFDTPEQEEWNRRLNSRPGKTIPSNIIQSMLKSYQEPTVDEGFAEIYNAKEFN